MTEETTRRKLRVATDHMICDTRRHLREMFLDIRRWYSFCTWILWKHDSLNKKYNAKNKRARHENRV